MSITFTKRIITSETQTKLKAATFNIIPTSTISKKFFFIIGRTNNGGRYYSETVDNYKEAYKLFSLYKSVVEYFGGGQVELACISKEGYDIIDIFKI